MNGRPGSRAAERQVEAILSGLPTSFSDKREQVVYEMATCLANSLGGKGLFERAVEALGHVGITDIDHPDGLLYQRFDDTRLHDVPAGATGMER